LLIGALFIVPKSACQVFLREKHQKLKKFCRKKHNCCKKATEDTVK